MQTRMSLYIYDRQIAQLKLLKERRQKAGQPLSTMAIVRDMIEKASVEAGITDAEIQKQMEA